MKTRALLTAAVSTLLIAIMLVSVGLEVGAQDGSTPTPEPDRNDPAVFYGDPPVATGDAEWTIVENTFESFFPNGFEFTVKVSSTGGEVEAATVVWSHAPRNVTRRAAEYDEANDSYVAIYPGIAEASLPPWVAVNYQWRFTDSAGNTYTTAWYMGEEYSDANNNWSRYESEDIIVFVIEGLPDNTGQLTMDAMAAARETYVQAWGAQLPNKPRAILYANREGYMQWQRGTGSAPLVVGTTNPEWGATVQRIAGGDIIDLTWGTIVHEVAHMYQAQFAPAGFAAGTWWNEGNATFFELNQQYDYEQRVRNLASRNQLPALLDGTGPGQNSTGPDGLNRLGYDVGYTFFKWLVLNYGLETHYAIISRVRTGENRNAILEEVLGMTAHEIEAQWRVWLGASPDAPTLIPTPTFPFRPTQTPFQFPTRSSE